MTTAEHPAGAAGGAHGRAGPAAAPAGPVLRSAYDVLAARTDRSRPFVTSYDGPDSCTELSVASTLNAVAKAAGLLRDELGLAPGARLSVDLPVHWQLPVWTLAGLTAGLVVGLEDPGPVDVRILGPLGLAALAAGADPRADEVLGCACDAFGMPVRGGVPPGVIDVGIAVRAHPDVFGPEPAAAGHAALLLPAGHRGSPPSGVAGGPTPERPIPSRDADAPTGSGPRSESSMTDQLPAWPGSAEDQGRSGRGTEPSGSGQQLPTSWRQLLTEGPPDEPGARSWVSAEGLAAAGLPPALLLRRAATDPLLRGGSVVLARNVSEADALRLRAVQGAALDRGGQRSSDLAE